MSDAVEPDVSEEHPVSEHWIWMGPHRPPLPRAFVERMTTDWAANDPSGEVHPAAAYTRSRRDRLAEKFAGRTLVVPTGNPKVRSNDTDYRFRAGTDFFYLTACEEPDTVLVLRDGAATLYIAPRRDQRSHAFFSDARYGELWVGARRGVEEAAAYYGIDAKSLDELEKDLVALGGAGVLVRRGFDAAVDAMVEPSEEEGELVEALGEMRLTKDEYEVARLREAIAATVKGFEDVVRALPEAVARGERVVEGVFNLRARVEGHDVGYDTIAASGAHATTLHWTRNDGSVAVGDLLLLDAGVESNDLYTADVTRTIPVGGQFSPAQRRVYELVRRAQQAGIDAVRPGVPFAAAHEAAMRVLVEGLVDLGLLEGDVETELRKDRQFYRRYTLHGTSHMLGADVHDCAQARNEVYLGEVREGYVFTVEPGLYFQANDLTVPEEYRGIGVRIEDDILVTATGAENLSAALPRDPDEIEAWMARLGADGPTNLGLTAPSPG